MRNWVMSGAILALIGCSTSTTPGGAPDETRTEMPAAADLSTSMEVEVADGTVRFVLHVTNSSAQPITLEFANAQRYDFEVEDASAGLLWRWSDGQMFAQMLGEEVIPAGSTRDYTASWQYGNRVGRFYAHGRVTASNRKIVQRTEFEIQKR
jgi:hypothetical protein